MTCAIVIIFAKNAMLFVGECGFFQELFTISSKNNWKGPVRDGIYIVFSSRDLASCMTVLTAWAM
jgi:hypothetical protein